MKIFLDVGGNVGQTLNEVLNPPYRFDIVHCFEPQAECYAEIKRKFCFYPDEHLVLHNFGLADFDGEKNLYGIGIGASLFIDKDDIDSSQSQKCRFVRASTFFDEHINTGDLVVMKLNCEGGELLILRDLIQSGHIHLLSTALIHFDIRKIPSQQQEQENIVSALKAIGFSDYVTGKQVRYGRGSTISAWLSTSPDADEIMQVTVWQKIARCFPIAMRCFIRVKLHKIRKSFLKICGRYPPKKQ